MRQTQHRQTSLGVRFGWNSGCEAKCRVPVSSLDGRGCVKAECESTPENAAKRSQQQRNRLENKRYLSPLA